MGKSFSRRSGKGLRNPVEEESEIACVPSSPFKSLEKSVSKQTVSSDSCSFISAVESKEIETDTDATADYDSAGENEFVLAQDSTDQKEKLSLTVLADTLSGLLISTPQSHNCSLFSVKSNNSVDSPQDQVEFNSEPNSSISQSYDIDPNNESSLNGILHLSNDTTAEKIAICEITPLDCAENLKNTRFSVANTVVTSVSTIAETHCNEKVSIIDAPREKETKFQSPVEKCLVIDSNFSKSGLDSKRRIHGHSDFTIEVINGNNPLECLDSVENFENTILSGESTKSIEFPTAKTGCDLKQEIVDTPGLNKQLSFGNIANNSFREVNVICLEPKGGCFFGDLKIGLSNPGEKKVLNAVELNFVDGFTGETNNVSREITLNTGEKMSINFTEIDNRLTSPAKTGCPTRNYAPIVSNGLKHLSKMDMDDKTIKNQSESSNFDCIANRSEAGPVTAEEFSIPLSDFDLNSLPCGERNTRLVGTRLARDSLFVQFDPIVEKGLANTENSPSPVRHLSQPAKRSQESSLEKTPMKNPTLDEKLISLTPCTTVDAGDANSSVSTEINSSSDSLFNKTLVNSNSNKTGPETDKCMRNCSVESDSETKPSSSTHTFSLQTKTPTPRNTARGTVVSQENYIKELEKLQELMAKQEQGYQEELNRNVEKMEKLQMDVSQLKKEVQAKSKTISQSSVVLGEYERTISQLLAQNEEDKKQFEVEKEKLIQERDTVTAHLNNSEFAFSDLFQKYERCKAVIEEMKNIQDSLKASNQDYDRLVKSQEEKYNKLRSHAAEQLEKARNEMSTIIRTTQTENEKLKANLKRAELTIKSKEDSLEQKTKDVAELTLLLDELIGKVSSDPV